MKVKPFKQQILLLVIAYLKKELKESAIVEELMQKYCEDIPEWIIQGNPLLQKGLSKSIKSFVQMDKKIKLYYMNRKSQVEPAEQNNKMQAQEAQKASEAQEDEEVVMKPKKMRKVSKQISVKEDTPMLGASAISTKKSKKEGIVNNGKHHQDTSKWVISKFQAPKKLEQIGLQQKASKNVEVHHYKHKEEAKEKSKQKSNKNKKQRKVSVEESEEEEIQMSDLQLEEKNNKRNKKSKTKKVVEESSSEEEEIKKPIKKQKQQTAKKSSKKPSREQQQSQPQQEQTQKPNKKLKGKKIIRQSSQSSSSSQQEERPKKSKKQAKNQKILQKQAQNHPSEIVKVHPQTRSNGNNQYKQSFSRINPEEVGQIPEKLRDNTFYAKFKYGKGDEMGKYGYEKLKDTRGQSFKKTKNKLKNRAFQGENIDFNAINSIPL